MGYPNRGDRDMIALLAVPVLVFLIENEKFFDTAIQQMKDGARWHYVSPQPPNPKAESIPGQICEPETGKCGDEYIIWQLRK